MVRAHSLQQRLLQGGTSNFGEFARDAVLSENRTALLLRLSWLAPDITQAILRGQQPPSLTADRLSRMPRIPMDWQAQKSLLGFG